MPQSRGKDPYLDLPLTGPTNVKVRWIMIEGREAAVQPWNGKGFDPIQGTFLPTPETKPT